jgi:hypothetical protein
VKNKPQNEEEKDPVLRNAQYLTKILGKPYEQCLTFAEMLPELSK